MKIWKKNRSRNKRKERKGQRKIGCGKEEWIGNKMKWNIMKGTKQKKKKGTREEKSTVQAASAKHDPWRQTAQTLRLDTFALYHSRYLSFLFSFFFLSTSVSLLLRVSSADLVIVYENIGYDLGICVVRFLLLLSFFSYFYCSCCYYEFYHRCCSYYCCFLLTSPSATSWLSSSPLRLLIFLKLSSWSSSSVLLSLFLLLLSSSSSSS